MKKKHQKIHFYRNTGLLALMLIGAVLSGCATMNKEECLTADWRAVGYEDGTRGYMASKIAEHRKACAEHGVTPDLDAYRAGRKEGLREFCKARNGYNLGIAGHGYAGTCPADLEEAFAAAYQQGRQIYTLRYQIKAKKNLKHKREHELEDMKADLVETSELLISDGKTKMERVDLLLRAKEIKEAMDSTSKEIDELGFEIEELQAQLDQVVASNQF